MRQAGWEDDAELLRLLQLFREYIWHYIYGAPGAFAEAVQPVFPGASVSLMEPRKNELNLLMRVFARLLAVAVAAAAAAIDKQVDEITTMTRSLMSHFAVVLSNKSFRMEGTLLVVDGREIWVDEHLYETMLNLAENQAGGVWHPDELGRFLLKIKQYKKFLLRKPAVFFSCIQIWGKSIADSRNKFYALRDMFEREQRAEQTQVQLARSVIEEKRFEMLEEVVGDVPAVPNKTIPQLPSSKMPKLWSSDELDMLLQCLVDITLDIQAKGTSTLVELMPGKLNRSEISIVNKLTDMREKYLAKSTYHRAAHLPDTLYDPTSSAYKVFNADWSNPNDPNVVGYLALKSNAAKLMARRNRLKKVSLPVKRASYMRKTRAKTQSKVEMTPKSSFSDRVLRTRSSDSKTEAQSRTEEHSEFVCDIAKQYHWPEETAHAICVGIKNAMHLYRTNKMKDFYQKVTAESPGLKLSSTFLNVQHLLNTFEKRFDSLDRFEEVALGLEINVDIDMSQDDVQARDSPQQQVAEVHRPVHNEMKSSKTGTALPLQNLQITNDCCLDPIPTPYDGEHTISSGLSRKKLVSFGKDDSKDMHSILQTSKRDEVEDLDTSPSANQSSPENYNSDGAEHNFSDGDGDAESNDYDTMEIQSVDSNDYRVSSSSAYRSIWDARTITEHEDDDSRSGNGYDYHWGQSNSQTPERSDTEQEADYMESDDDHEPMETDVVVKQDQPQWQQDMLNSLEQNIMRLEERRRQLAHRRELRESRREESITWSSDLQVEVISVVHGVLP